MENDLDSLFSCVKKSDHFLWKKNINGHYVGVKHDHENRKFRQEIYSTFFENGSFYIFKPELIRKYERRLTKKVGIYNINLHKQFQIDTEEDFKLCEIIMNGYGLNQQ
ncbi:MAG: hypothetical protein AB8G05_02285 [Oligoflexales bacterium]